MSVKDFTTKETFPGKLLSHTNPIFFEGTSAVARSFERFNHAALRHFIRNGLLG